MARFAKPLQGPFSPVAKHPQKHKNRPEIGRFSHFNPSAEMHPFSPFSASQTSRKRLCDAICRKKQLFAGSFVSRSHSFCSFTEIDTSTEEYIVDAEGILVSLTKYLTLFPGDVVSLGRISTLLEVPADIVAKDGIHGTAGIEGLGELPFHFVKDTEAEEAETVREGF